jgi:uncharacterized membrane protein YraQ (UPF0718 family)
MMASEKISLLKMAVVGVLAIIGLLYLMKLVSWLLSLAIVGAALLGAGVIGYALARSLLGGDKEQASALPAAKASDEIAFEFEAEEEDSDFMREMKALEAKERRQR